MATLCPYLRFNDGKCREAMEYYRSVFGGNVEYMVMADTPMANDVPEDRRGYIMHAELQSGDLKFFGSDMMRDEAIVGDAVGIALQCSSEDELREHFAKLSDGGEAFMPPEDAFWGGLFAVATDRYGVEWMLNFQREPAR